MSEYIEQLHEMYAERDRLEKQLVQERHQLQRLKNRVTYLAKGERAERTHRLCNIGGTIESLAPKIKELTKVEMIELMESIFSMPDVIEAVNSAYAKSAGGRERE